MPTGPDVLPGDMRHDLIRILRDGALEDEGTVPVRSGSVDEVRVDHLTVFVSIHRKRDDTARIRVPGSGKQSPIARQPPAKPSDRFGGFAHRLQRRAHGGQLVAHRGHELVKLDHVLV